MNLQIAIPGRPQPMKYRVRKQHRAEWIVVGIEWSESFKVGFRNRIRENDPAVTRNDERFGGVFRRMRNGVQQDDLVFLLG